MTVQYTTTGWLRMAGVGWMLAVAEVGAVQQPSVGTSDVSMLDSRVYPPARASNYLTVCEILLQVLVVGEEQASAADGG